MKKESEARCSQIMLGLWTSSRNSIHERVEGNEIYLNAVFAYCTIYKERKGSLKAIIKQLATLDHRSNNNTLKRR